MNQELITELAEKVYYARQRYFCAQLMNANPPPGLTPAETVLRGIQQTTDFALAQATYFEAEAALRKAVESVPN